MLPVGVYAAMALGHATRCIAVINHVGVMPEVNQIQAVREVYATLFKCIDRPAVPCLHAIVLALVGTITSSLREVHACKLDAWYQYLAPLQQDLHNDPSSLIAGGADNKSTIQLDRYIQTALTRNEVLDEASLQEPTAFNLHTITARACEDAMAGWGLMVGCMVGRMNVLMGSEAKNLSVELFHLVVRALEEVGNGYRGTSGQLSSIIFFFSFVYLKSRLKLHLCVFLMADLSVRSCDEQRMAATHAECPCDHSVRFIPHFHQEPRRSTCCVICLNALHVTPRWQQCT
jgi:hypothetical protein